MQNVVVGKKYTFIDESAKNEFIKSHSINARIAAQMDGDVFTVVSGRLVYTDKSSVTDVIDTTVQNAETISVNGTMVNTGSQVTAIGNSELRYFVEYISTKERIDKEFKSMRFETLVNIYLHYHPNAAESKITMSSLRKCWIHHSENVKKKQSEFEQMKADLEQLISLTK
ncbi:hypothetical protein AsFcp4_104 [Aeromonas phage AsFcp_4]|nr:hypothetical protein AsFcp4_104 [Aeromonas phage AsFcp_4]